MGLGRRLADAVLEREVRKEVAKKDIYLYEIERAPVVLLNLITTKRWILLKGNVS